MSILNQTSFESFPPTGKPTKDVVSLENVIAYPREKRSELINRICVFKNSLYWQGGPSEMMNCDAAEKEYYYLLRDETVHLINYIDTVEKDSPRITELGKSLFGSGGCGKSSLLFFIANYCHSKKWLVMYWSHGSNDSSKESVFTDSKSVNLVNYFLKDNQQFDLKLSDSFTATEKLFSIISYLYQQHEYRVLIAIDEWNIFLTSLRRELKNDKKFIEFFTTFQTSGDLTNGIFIGAMSSQSFYELPLDVFNDALRQSSSIIIQPYNPTEFKAHIDLAIHCGMISSPLTVEDVDNYLIETGGIPRLFNWILSSKDTFNSKVNDYYIQRMTKFIERFKINSPNTSQTRSLSFQDIAVSVYLNRSIICHSILITPWLEYGLLVRSVYEDSQDNDLEIFDAPCPIARMSIYSCLARVQDCDSLINFLITDKQTKGKALGLLFMKPFIDATHSSPVSLKLTSTMGKVFNIEVKKVVPQSKPYKGEYSMQRFEKGTLVICHDHELIDFYIHNNDGSNIFIQISGSEQCEGDTRNLKLLWEDIVKESKKRKRKQETEVEETDEEPQCSEPLILSKRMKARGVEYTIRNYYRVCSGERATEQLTPMIILYASPLLQM